MFSQDEILLMIGVVSVLLLVITILTIFDIRDYIKNKRKQNIIEEEEYNENNANDEIKEEIKYQENIEVLEVNDNNDINEIEEVHEDFNFEPIVEEYNEIEPVKKNNDIVVEEVSSVKDNTINDLNDELTKALEPIKEEEVISRFEEEQERTAIISLDELMKKTNELYNQNELTQYDDGNEPISIDEVISLYNKEEKSVPIVMQDIVEDGAYSHKESYPFISSVYGIEKNNMEFENTATYEKLSREKDNDFMIKLREINEKNS